MVGYWLTAIRAKPGGVMTASLYRRNNHKNSARSGFSAMETALFFAMGKALKMAAETPKKRPLTSLTSNNQNGVVIGYHSGKSYLTRFSGDGHQKNRYPITKSSGYWSK